MSFAVSNSCYQPRIREYTWNFNKW
jgi:hypothetical protein